MWLLCSRSECPFYTSQPARLARHTSFHGDRSVQSDISLSISILVRTDRMLICPEKDCGKHFFSLQKCLSHDRKFHTGLTEWQCRLCFKHVTDIKVHFKIHSEERKYQCQKCSMKFRHKNSLARHVWQHEENKPEKCKERFLKEVIGIFHSMFSND